MSDDNNDWEDETETLLTEDQNTLKRFNSSSFLTAFRPISVQSSLHSLKHATTYLKTLLMPRSKHNQDSRSTHTKHFGRLETKSVVQLQIRRHSKLHSEYANNRRLFRQRSRLILHDFHHKGTRQSIGRYSPTTRQTTSNDKTYSHHKQSQTFAGMGVSRITDESRYNGTINRTKFYNNPAIPFTLSLYMQFIMNVVVCTIFLYFIYHFFAMVSADIDMKIEEYSSAILAEIEECSRKYHENKCQRGLRVPALEKACAALEKCMERDPKIVGRTKVSAETLSEAFEHLVKPLSFKTWSILLGLFVVALAFPNALFSFFRSSKQSYLKKSQLRNDESIDSGRYLAYPDSVQYHHEQEHHSSPYYGKYQSTGSPVLYYKMSKRLTNKSAASLHSR